MEGDVNAVESAAIPDKEICTEIVILLFVGRSQCVIILSRIRDYIRLTNIIDDIHRAYNFLESENLIT